MRKATRVVLGLCSIALVGCDQRENPPGVDGPWDHERPNSTGPDGGSPDGPGDEPDGGNPWDDVPGCTGDTVVVDVRTPNVMLVLDRSGSMTRNVWAPSGGGQPETRWRSLHGVVTDLVSTFDDRVNFGASLFPTDGIDGEVFEAACAVADAAEVPIGPHNGAAVLAAMPAAHAQTVGGTPATGGVLNALDALGDVAQDEPAAMVLVTDGIANCADPDDVHRYDDGLAEAVKDAYGHDGIRTYVVGIDISDAVDGTAGVNPRDALDDVARSGGAPRPGEDAFYGVSSAAELTAAMGSIATQIECTIPLPEPPSEPNFMRVRVGGTTVDHVQDCAAGDGWRFSSAGSYDTIELCGSVCADVRAQGQLETQYSCPPEG